MLELCSLVHCQNLQPVFPNTDSVLHMSSCMAVSNHSAEWFCSTSKHINTYLMSSMLENWLNSLALVAIKTDLMTEIDFEDIIKDFVTLKSRWKPVHCTQD